MNGLVDDTVDTIQFSKVVQLSFPHTNIVIIPSFPSFFDVGKGFLLHDPSVERVFFFLL